MRATTRKLEILAMPFDEELRKAWREKDFSLLEKSRASGAIKADLIRRAGVRPKRFFGEAYVASKIDHDEGYYCPFKWLTSEGWCDSTHKVKEESSGFKAALLKHFPNLREFQKDVSAFRQENDLKPVGPDLWLITEKEHRFLEVKMPGDKLNREQVAGLALLASRLRGDRPISAGVVVLDNSAAVFEEFVKRIPRVRR